MLARRIVGRPHGMEGPPSDGVYGDFDGEPIRMAMLGDSLSVGLGPTDPAETPGALIASGLATIAERPVRLTVAGKSGAVSAELGDQVDQALRSRPEVAIIFIGANDVTTQTMPAAGRTAPAEGGVAAAGGGGRGGRGHLPRPGHGPADRAAAALGDPALEPPAGRGADHRRGRGGRADGGLRGPAGAGVRTNPTEMFGLIVTTHPLKVIYRLLTQCYLLYAVRWGCGLSRDPARRVRNRSTSRRPWPRRSPGPRSPQTRVAGRATGAHGRWATLLRRRPVVS